MIFGSDKAGRGGKPRAYTVIEIGESVLRIDVKTI